MSSVYEDQGDGSYSVEYAAKVVGQYKISLMLNLVHISGSPFDVALQPGKAFPRKVLASGPGVQSPEGGDEGLFLVRADRVVATFTLSTFDRYSNLKSAGGDEFDVEIRFLDETSGYRGVSSMYVDEGDGTYTVSTRNPKPETRKLRPEARKLIPRIQNAKP